jgi:hypothetical protein
MKIIKNYKNEMVCELILASEIGEAEKALKDFYYSEYRHIDTKLLPRIEGKKDEGLIKKQTEIAFMDYFETHVRDGVNVKISDRDAIYEALTRRVAEMEEEI